MVERDCPIERVLAVHREHRRANPDAPLWSTPLFRWAALHDLAAEQQRFRAGDQTALLAAVAICAHCDMVMPEWLAVEFRNAYFSGIHHHVASWDDVFGRPLPKGKWLARARDRLVKRVEVYNLVNEILDTEYPKPPIDEALFERVGVELGVSKTIASELYYEFKKIFPEPEMPAIREFAAQRRRMRRISPPRRPARS